MNIFKEIDYEFRNYKGKVLVEETIKDEKEIKEICMKDYLEQLSKEIKFIKGDM